MLICVKSFDFLYSVSRSLSFARKKRTYGSLLIFLLQSSKKRHRCRLGNFWKAQLLSFGLIRHLRHTYVRTVHCSIGNSIPLFELMRILKGVPPAARPPPRPASSYFSSSPPWRFPSLRILWLGRGGRRTWVSASASCSSPSPHGPIREEKRGRCDGGLGVGRLLTFIAGLLLLPVSGERGGPKFGWGERERGQWIRGSHP